MPPGATQGGQVSVAAEREQAQQDLGNMLLLRSSGGVLCASCGKARLVSSKQKKQGFL